MPFFKHTILISALAAILAIPCIAVAADPHDLYLSQCEATPEIVGAGADYPGRGKIVPSNKLALPAGKSIYASGELVYLSGRVLDANCVPVSDAIIELWQADPYGKYGIATAGSRANPYPVFSGSGRAITDNLGRYNFVTLFPGPYESRAPHIHIKILHPDFATLNTEIYFEGDRRNASDKKLARLKGSLRDRLLAETWPKAPGRPDEGVFATFDITLKGKNKYRRF